MSEEFPNSATRSGLETRRKTYSVASIIATVLLCAFVAIWSGGHIVAKAAAILLVSLVGFHIAAWFSFDRKQAWLALDYAMEIITIISLMAVVAGIQQSAVAEILQSEFARRKSEQASLIYSIKSTIDRKSVV